MNEKPWMKFFTGDWIKGTRRLKPEPKSAWIDLLCYMWENVPRGELFETDEHLAIMLGMDGLVARTTIAELVDRGFLTRLKICPKCAPGPFSFEALSHALSASCPHLVPPFVRILSRRMSRECHAQIVRAAQQQNRRARDTLRKQRQRSHPCNKNEASHYSEVICQSKENTKENEAFETFWNTYPKKVAKVQAVKAWVKLRPNPDLAAKITQSVEAFKLTESWTKDSGQFVPHPATFLNQRRWEDQVPPPPHLEIVL
jgi:hypothetical protein